MKSLKTRLAVVVLALSATSPAWSLSHPGSDAALFGSQAPMSYATRTVALAPGMKYVNVDSGETVAFRAGGQTIAWTFAESVHGASIDLGLLLPAVPDAQGVRVFIDRSRLFSGG